MTQYLGSLWHNDDPTTPLDEARVQPLDDGVRDAAAKAFPLDAAFAAAATTFTPAWHSWRPNATPPQAGPEPSIGNGTLQGWYWNVGKLWVITWKLTHGSLTTYPTGVTDFTYLYLGFPPGFSPTMEQAGRAHMRLAFGNFFEGTCWFHTGGADAGRLFVDFVADVSNAAGGAQYARQWGVNTNGPAGPFPHAPNNGEVITATGAFIG